jgi:hypothetical protein
METKQWGVRIDISEAGDNTHVRAVLSTMSGTTVEGVGHARRKAVGAGTRVRHRQRPQDRPGRMRTRWPWSRCALRTSSAFRSILTWL